MRCSGVRRRRQRRVDAEQDLDVEGGVGELGRGERPQGPVGLLRSLVEPEADLFSQPAERPPVPRQPEEPAGERTAPARAHTPVAKRAETPSVGMFGGRISLAGNARFGGSSNR